jgi:hypothetical protein
MARQDILPPRRWASVVSGEQALEESSVVMRELEFTLL